MFVASRLSSRLFRYRFLPIGASRFLSTPVADNSPQQEASRYTAPNMEFLKEIVARSKEENGARFVLPVADPSAIQKILNPLTTLTEEGVEPNVLKDVLSSNPGLLELFLKEGDNCVKVANSLVSYCSLTLENSLRFLAEVTSEVDVSKHKDIANRLNFFAGLGFVSGPQLARLVRKCPALLYVSDLETIGTTFDSLSGFFPRKPLMRVLSDGPHILLMPFAETELKYEYIYFHMGIEPEKLVMSTGWIDMTLEEIMMRADFLRKTGRYKTPDEKKPQIEMRNPSPHQIFDSSDQYFASEIVGVTDEEWMIFQTVYRKQKELEDKDEPYERIKLSLRKKFERRIKEAIEKDTDYYIEYDHPSA